MPPDGAVPRPDASNYKGDMGVSSTRLTARRIARSDLGKLGLQILGLLQVSAILLCTCPRPLTVVFICRDGLGTCVKFMV